MEGREAEKVPIDPRPTFLRAPGIWVPLISDRRPFAARERAFRSCRGTPYRRGSRPARPRSHQACSELYAFVKPWQSRARQHRTRPSCSPKLAIGAAHPVIWIKRSLTLPPQFLLLRKVAPWAFADHLNEPKFLAW